MADFFGTSGQDTISGNFLSDAVTSQPPGATLTREADRLFGYGGNDDLSLFYFGWEDSPEQAGDSLYGGQGDDRLNDSRGGGDDLFSGGPGDDTIDLASGDNTVLAGSGDDNIYDGFGFDDLILAGQGNDFVTSRFGADTIHGGSGDDRIVALATSGARITGGSGNDTITTLYGDGLTIEGGPGTDLFTVGSDSPGRPGYASVFLNIATGETGRAGTTITGFEQIATAPLGPDTIIGSNADNFISTGGDNDVITGLAGDDSIFAGSRSDTVYGGGGNDSITSDILTGDLLRGGFGDDNIRGGGTLSGGAGDDTLFGQGRLFGGSGDDSLRAIHALDNPPSANYIDGGSGNDTLRGGGEADRFVFRSFDSGENSTTIVNFRPGTDSLLFRAVTDLFGDIIEAGADADTNGDGVIDGVDRGWTTINGADLTFTGANTKLILQDVTSLALTDIL